MPEKIATEVAPTGIATEVAPTGGPAPKTAAELGLMHGHPVPAEKRVTRENFMDAPFNRWGLQHIDELLPTRIVRRAGPVAQFERREQDLSALTATMKNGRELSVADWLDASYTDAFLVLHDGAIVYERYFNDQTPETRHVMFSVTKSVTATMLLCLAESGAIDTTAPVTHYLPELQGSVYDEVTVQQVMDMTVAVVFDEDYEARPTEFGAYCAVFGIGFGPPDHADVHQFLASLEKRAEHGGAFQYATPNTEVLGWLIRRATGQSLADVLQDTLWSKLGCERDAYYWLDVAGTEMAGAGLNVTLRDAGRFGQMILNGGAFMGQQVIPAAVADRILQPGDPDVFCAHYDEPLIDGVGYAYHDQWWTYGDPNKQVGGVGIHGQFITIDAVTGTVIVKQSSDPEADSVVNESHGAEMNFAIASYLGGHR